MDGQKPKRSARFESQINLRRTKSDVPGSSYEEQTRKETLYRSLEHLHGPKEVRYGVEDLVVLCLVRNGQPYVKSFVEHYFSFGAKHIFVLDNGSTDGTVEALRSYRNVSVFRTELPFKEYQMLMKQYLFERFGRGRWSLYVDIDELFDYPYSDVVSLSSFLRYLTQESYTGVVAHMLDVFPEGPISDATIVEDEPLKERYRFYDISDIYTRSYWSAPFVSGTGNTLANKEIKIFAGGIQQTIFGLAGPLTKHPLIFFDGKNKPMDGSSHAVSNARVADLTCVLFHYRFFDHLYEKVRRAAREENYMKDSYKHKIILKVLEQNPSLHIRRDTSRELESVNDLVENQFLVVSDKYVAWADMEEKRVTRAGKVESRGLAKAYFKAKAKAQTAKVLQLEQHVEEQERELAGRDRQVQRLERQLDNFRGKLESVRHEARLLRQRNRNLTQEVQSMQASRSWRLLTKLGRIWAK